MAEPTRAKKFVKDLGIYAVGNLGAKMITFLLIPLYTHYITDTADYGYYELVQTISFCFIPMLCCQMTDGGFRFLIETKDIDRHRAIISYVAKLLTRNSLVLVALAAVYGFLFPTRHLEYIIAYGIFQTAYEVVVQLVRGLGYTKYFVLAGILNAATTAVLSTLFLCLFGFGIEGIFLSIIMAKVVTILVLNWRVGLWRNYISGAYIDKGIAKELLKYSLPLIPVAIGWWFVSANNQFFIERYLGLTETGYYGIVGKFTGILYMLCYIFYQTWQQNAIEQYNSPDRNLFFSSVFNNYFFLLCALVSIFPFALRFNYSWLVGENYQDSSQYMFLNSLYVMAFSLAAFFEIAYQCAKRTARILPSLLLSIAVSIACNFLLIERLGVNGVIISSILTYSSLLIYRLFDTRKFIRIRFDWRNIAPIVVLISCFVLYYQPLPRIVDLIVCLSAVFLFVLMAPGDFKKAVVKKCFSGRHKS